MLCMWILACNAAVVFGLCSSVLADVCLSLKYVDLAYLANRFLIRANESESSFDQHHFPLAEIHIGVFATFRGHRGPGTTGLRPRGVYVPCLQSRKHEHQSRSDLLI